MDFTFVTDHGRHMLHYIASGIGEAHEELDRLYVRDDVTCKSSHHVARAKLLRWAIGHGVVSDVDWNVPDAGCVLHQPHSLDVSLSMAGMAFCRQQLITCFAARHLKATVPCTMAICYAFGAVQLLRGHQFTVTLVSALLPCRGKTPVFWAVVSHSTDVLDVLCAYARQRAIPLNVSSADHAGNTALDLAVASQQWRAVKVLVQHGALEVRARHSHTFSALALACKLAHCM